MVDPFPARRALPRLTDRLPLGDRGLTVSPFCLGAVSDRGMVPLAFAMSEGAEQRAPMGQAVIGGVITSSLLTLVVVPVIYCYLDDLARWAARKFRGTPAPAGSLSAP